MAVSRPDPAAAEFQQWAAAARPRLRRTAYLLCGDWHLAEDVTQETLVRVFSVWGRVSATGAPDAYARRTLVNAFHASARRPWRREHLVDALPDTADGAAADATGGRDERDALLTALAGLGRSQRAIVVLRYWEDLSVTEVANALDLSTGAVKSQASRGLAHLRRALTPSTPTSGGTA